MALPEKDLIMSEEICFIDERLQQAAIIKMQML